MPSKLELYISLLFAGLIKRTKDSNSIVVGSFCQSCKLHWHAVEMDKLLHQAEGG